MKQLIHGKGELVRVTAYIVLLRPRHTNNSLALHLYNQSSNYTSGIVGHAVMKLGYGEQSTDAHPEMWAT